MFRVLIICGAIAFASSAAAYDNFNECVQVQISIDSTREAMSEASETFGRLFRKQSIGDAEARAADDAYKAAKAALQNLAEAHAAYCKALPVTAP